MDAKSQDAMPKIDREALREKLRAEFEATLMAVADAVDQAPYGAWIDVSEEPSRQALDRFRKTMFEAALQAKLDAAEAAFSPSARRNDQPPAAP